MKNILSALVIMFSFFMFSNTVKANEPNEIHGPDIIYKQSTSVLLINDIVALYSVDGESVDLIYDNYTGNGDVPGIYQIRLQYGSTTKTAEIEVKNVIHSKVIAVSKMGNEYSIHVNRKDKLSNADLVKVLERVGLYQVASNDQVLKLTDTYTENYNSPGVYLFEIQVVNANGSSDTYQTKVVVSRDHKINLDGEVIDLGNSFPYVEIMVTIIIAAVIILIVKRRG